MTADFNPEDQSDQPPHLPAPWEESDNLPAAASGKRPRHDAFTLARRAAFLTHLAKTGCILDACRAVSVSSRTVYRLQESDGEFRRHCELALAMARTPVELAAWERGVVGVEEDYVRGGQVFTRIRRSDSILRLLLQGSNRKKYGPRPGFTRKRLRAWERKQMERDIRDAMRAKEPSPEAVTQSILRKVAAIERHREGERLAAGWTKTEDGHWIPPGWVRAEGGDPPPHEPPEKGDSM